MTKLTDHAGHIITMNKRFHFDVTGPHVNTEYCIYDDAIIAIDTAMKKAEKQARTKLSLSAVNDKGEPVTLTGVHASQGTVTGCETDAYPPVDWIVELLKERVRCMARVQQIGQAIRGLHVAHRRNYGAPCDYDDAIANLKRDYEDVLKKAQKRAPKQEIAA